MGGDDLGDDDDDDWLAPRTLRTSGDQDDPKDHDDETGVGVGHDDEDDVDDNQYPRAVIRPTVITKTTPDHAATTTIVSRVRHDTPVRDQYAFLQARLAYRQQELVQQQQQQQQQQQPPLTVIDSTATGPMLRLTDLYHSPTPPAAQQASLSTLDSDDSNANHRINLDGSSSSSFLTRFQHAVGSRKKLKEWRVPQSPCVLVLCHSARRAVELLKELSSSSSSSRSESEVPPLVPSTIEESTALGHSSKRRHPPVHKMNKQERNKQLRLAAISPTATTTRTHATPSATRSASRLSAPPQFSLRGVRALKLFAKHLDVATQQQQLTTPGASFAYAVGTPHRILALARSGHLRLSHTQLILLDAPSTTSSESLSSSKGLSVCTLPETEEPCLDFLLEFVLPQMQSRRDGVASSEHELSSKKRKRNNKGNAGKTALKIAFL